MEKLVAIFEGFDIEKLGQSLPSADALLDKMGMWLVLLVLAGPLLMLGFGLYYLFFAPEEANHSMGYRFFYAMSQVRVWQYAQRLAGLAYSALGGILLLIIGLISLRFAHLAPPDMVWLAAKCLLWEIILVIIATLAVDIIIVLLFDIKGEPRKNGIKLPAFLAGKSTPHKPAAASTQSSQKPTTSGKPSSQRPAAPQPRSTQPPAAQRPQRPAPQKAPGQPAPNKPQSQSASKKPQAQGAQKKTAPQNLPKKNAPQKGQSGRPQSQNAPKKSAPQKGQPASRKPQNAQRSNQKAPNKK